MDLTIKNLSNNFVDFLFGLNIDASTPKNNYLAHSLV